MSVSSVSFVFHLALNKAGITDHAIPNANADNNETNITSPSGDLPPIKCITTPQPSAPIKI